MGQEVITTYLEMNDPEKFSPKEGYREKMMLKQIANDRFVNFMLFAGVGLPWRWFSRAHWSPSDWEEYFLSHRVETFLAFSGNVLAGYFELEIQDGGDVEIKFIGLLPDHLEKGFGGYLISHAADRAWSAGAKRVWLHTCSNDHPNALNGYLKRGFRIYDQVNRMEETPAVEELLDAVRGYFSGYLGRGGWRVKSEE